MSEMVTRGAGVVKQVEHVFGPLLVKGGDESLVFHDSARVKIPEGLRLVRVGSFLGVDTGDMVECHAEVLTGDQVRVYARSLHKEASVIYDAWDWQDAEASGLSLNVDVLCRVTGRNWAVFTKRLNPLTAFFHAAVVLEFKA